MIKELIGLVLALSSFIALVLPSLKRKNEALEKENETNNSVINSVKNAEKIKTENSKLSKSDLISGL